MKHNPDGTLVHVQVRGGPCDGLEVPFPPSPGETHCIAMPGPAEMQPATTEQGTVYCFYLWMIHRGEYHYVDQRHCSGNREAELVCLYITKGM